MAVLTGVTLTTEKDAVNTLLRSIGEAPLGSTVTVDTANSSAADVQMAVDILKATMRTTLATGWKFNFRSSVEIKPAITTYTWTDTGGVSTVINIFKRPTNVLDFTMTSCRENGDLDLVEQPSEKYLEAGASVMVLYDQTYNREGAEKAKYPYVYLDVFRTVDFEQLPEVAREYIVAISSHQLAKNLLGSVERSQFTAEDIQTCWQLLVRKFGLKKRYNILDNPGAQEFFGGRPNPVLRNTYRVKKGHT